MMMPNPSSLGALSAPDYVALRGRPVKGAPCGRVAYGDGLAGEIDTATVEAVRGPRACGYSWAEIGSRLGITRPAAQQRWGTA